MHVLSIKPELILAIYMASSVSVLLFNIFYIFADKYKIRWLKKNSGALEEKICSQLELIQTKGEMDEAHFKQLKRRLKGVENLRAFQNALDVVAAKYPAQIVDRYVEKLRGVFLVLAPLYVKRDTIEQAYFASLVERFHIDRGYKSFDGLMETLIQIVSGKDVYARENALKALYSIGNEQSILTVWEVMEAEDIIHSRKLLADGLLGFSGDKEKLARRLLESMDRFTADRILPIMQFIRFSSGSFQREFWDILQSESADKELKLEAIRYFQKNPYEPARQTLQNLVRYGEFVDWEFAAVSAVALGSYPGTDTVNCLKEGLHAGNWYVRLNCAETLIYGIGVAQIHLFDIYNGPDRYAREVLRYASERAALRRQQMELEKDYV